MRFAPDASVASTFEALLAPSSRHSHPATVTAFFDEEITKNPNSTGGVCDADGEMLWTKSSDGKQSRYSLCYAPAYRKGGQGPTGGGLTCEPHSYVTVEGPRFCCRNPRMTLEGQVLHSKVEVCGDLQADFDTASQKIRYVRGPSSDGTPELQEALEDSGMGTALPSPIGRQAMEEGSEWKNLLGQRCKGRDGTLITWPSGRTEMCPTGTQPVHGAGYMSWQCDGAYKKERRLHCCSVRKARPGVPQLMKCVPKLTDLEAPKCNCPGMGGSGWSENEEDKAADETEGTQESVGLPPLPALLLSSFGLPGRSRELSRRGCSRQLGQQFL